VSRLLALFLALSCGVIASGARPGIVRAQDVGSASAAEERPCADGRVRVEGYCCWPDQRWDGALGRCEGAPTCPAGRVEHGADCVATSPAVTALPEPGPSSSVPSLELGSYAEAAQARRGPASFASSTAGWPSVHEVSDVPERRVFVGRGEDEGLIVAALVVFDVGWVLGWLGTMLGEIGGSCTDFSGPFGSRRVSCDAWGWSLVPIGGAITAGIVSHHGSRTNFGVGIGFGVPATILQGIGAIMAIVAFSNETTELVFQPVELGRGLSASLDLGAPGSDMGLSFGLTF
jgi:hypothetical protein